MTKAALYEEARHLRIAGRSNMSRTELETAIASARRAERSSDLVARFHEKRIAAVGFLVALWPTNARAADVHLRKLLRTPGPLRAAILSLAALAAGVLGLIVAYGVVPNESAAGENASTLRLVTVTGPEGTTTLAITKTKEGKTKLVPVRVLRTVTGPEGVRTLSIEVAGPAVTQIHDSTLTQIVMNTLTEQSTVTNVVTETQIQPVTVTEVVHQTDTVVVTETVVVDVTGP